jgi:lipopolysaccharide export system protein LptA
MMRAILLAALLALSPAAALAQSVDTTAAAAESKSDKAVDIESNEMEILDDKKMAIFTGKVKGKRGDVTLNCDKLVVNYVETVQPDGTKKTDVTFLDASGSVVIVTSKQTVTGQWAKMDVKANKINIGGRVKVVQGATVLTGEKLFVDLDKNVSEMSGGRVRGTFSPGN